MKERGIIAEDTSTPENRRYRRYYSPDMLRNLDMLSPFDMLRNLKYELENSERGLGHHIFDREHPYRPPLLRISMDFPHADIFDEGDKLRIALEIPGTTKEDIELDMEEEHFRIHAKTRFEKCVESAYFVRCEEREGEFEREFKLPSPVNPEAAKASYKNDILEIEVPKKKQERKRTKVAIE
ncbi:MAG: Hsp20/alpha crystallin family protein [Thermoplasmata archaeon]|nr:MAG: Hsp20/alpha crystallin family protein [Thermoplasmata archaeon]